MSNFKNSIEKFITCEIHYKNTLQHLAKIDNGNWVAVLEDGTLDAVEVSPADLESTLDVFESIGATIRFTNHSAA